MIKKNIILYAVVEFSKSAVRHTFELINKSVNTVL